MLAFRLLRCLSECVGFVNEFVGFVGCVDGSGVMSLAFVWQATSPYLSGVPGVGSTYAQYYAPQLMPAVLGHDPAAAAASPLGVMQQPVLQQKLPRTDRLEVRPPPYYYTPHHQYLSSASQCCHLHGGRLISNLTES